MFAPMLADAVGLIPFAFFAKYELSSATSVLSASVCSVRA
jgi:hypothetical protein